MRGFFVTVRVSDAGTIVDAWNRAAGYEFGHVSFVLRGAPNDEEILREARAYAPDVIFYVGAAGGEGLPSIETLRELRRMGPTVNLGWDFADPPWYPLLDAYHEAECFDLMVALDGVKAPHVNMATVTPINPAYYDGPEVERTTRCGFTGNIPSREYMDIVRKLHGTGEQRADLLHPLGDLVMIRQRDVTSPYEDYVDFLRHCKLAINTSMTGSGATHHVKGRVIEIPLAGAALLEMAESPTSHWLPENSYFKYKDMDEAAWLIRTLEDGEIAMRARKAAKYVRSRYHPSMIYKAILSRLGL